MDGLIESIRRLDNPSVVGLDPRPDLLPGQLLDQALAQTETVLDEAGIRRDDPEAAPQVEGVWAERLAAAYLRFNLAVIDGVAGLVPAVKPQIAMYEALGPAGIRAYTATCRAAHERGLYVLGDIKRGDIGSTAAAYAGHLSGLPLTYRKASCARGGGSQDGRTLTGQAGPLRPSGATWPWYEDAVTVNPYLGGDGVLPFVEAACAGGQDVFVLVRTSNPSGADFQDLKVEGTGESPATTLADRVGRQVGEWGSGSVGGNGYSRVAAVVGATHPGEGARLRRALPHTFFLVPGYGAQGGRADDVAPMFDGQGSGALVNSSRGIIGAWRSDRDYSPSLSLQAALGLVSRSAGRAATGMRDSLRKAIKEGR